MNVLIFQDLFFYMEHIIFLGIIASRLFSLLSRLSRFKWTIKCHFHSSHIMRCIHKFGMYAAHALYIRPPYAIESRRLPRVRGMYAVNTQWSSSLMQHHTQWHRHSYAIYAACASPMCHWYAVDTQHMRNSSAGDVPPNHLGDLAAYLLLFSYAVWAPWHRRPVEQGH